MRPSKRGEPGQAMVEMAIIITALFFLTIGLVTVALGFYQYNALAAGARYGARWAAVVGGTCTERQSDSPNATTGDWCDQYHSAYGQSFWNQTGTYPVQSAGTSCPSSYSSSSSYAVSTYAVSGGTSIAGAIAKHFDTNSSAYSNAVLGDYMPAFDESKLYVCIQPAYSSTTSGNNGNQTTTYSWQFGPGEPVKVVLYYHYAPISGLLSKTGWDMTASSTYVTQ